MVTLFFDENVKVGLASELRQHGIAVRTTREEDRLGTIDADQLLHAAHNGWTIVTQNRRDFEPLHEGWATWTTAWGIRLEHGGILALDSGPLVPELAVPIIAFLKRQEPLINRLWNWYAHGRRWEEFVISAGKRRGRL